jgi:hypothetical protein
MSDTVILVLVAFGFAWGYGTARAMDILGRLEDEKRNKEAIRAAYLRQRRVRLNGDEWGDNAGA